MGRALIACGKILTRRIDKGGISHHGYPMKTATEKSKEITVINDYDVAADAKNRITLRGAKAKFFHVQTLSNGAYLLEPRILVPPDAIPAKTLKMLERSAANLKKGNVSAPIDLSLYQQG